jgi:ppGpp synthetase/RelA/SpoT-type nucleotidyltranferase
MSWHARQKWMRKHRARPVEDQPEIVQDPVTVRIYKSFNDGIVHRCRECGAWMIDVCNTDHGRRYEP